MRKIISATLQTTIATKGTLNFFALQLIKSVLFVWGEVKMETSSKQFKDSYLSIFEEYKKTRVAVFGKYEV